MSERLPRLPQNVGLFLPSGRPSQTMQRWWERVCEEIESSRSYMDDINDLTIYADYTGTVTAGQLPQNVAAKRYFQETDVTTSSTWTFEVVSGSVTATIGAATGVLNITAIGAAESNIKISSVRGGLTVYKTFNIYRSDGAPPSSGSGGGTSASDSSFSTINAAVMAAISNELTVTVGSAGEVALSAPLTVSTSATAPDGEFDVYGIWQWWDGAAWVDRGTEVVSNPSALVVDLGTGLVAHSGTLSVSNTHTGLAPASSQQYRLMARNASGTRVMSFSGTASAVGS